MVGWVYLRELRGNSRESGEERSRSELSYNEIIGFDEHANSSSRTGGTGRTFIITVTRDVVVTLVWTMG